jgi:hypothetical protein
MATSANVTATLIIKGQDQASAQIEKSTKAAKGLTDQLQQTQSKAQGLTGALRGIASGDIGGFGKLKDTLGGSGGIGPMLATTALGVASVGVAIGAAAIKVTEWSIEIERLRAQMQFAFAGGEAQAIATAQAIGGVAVESVVKLQTTLKASGAEGKITVEALQGIANAATAMGKTGDDALTAFADALRTGSTESLKQVGVFVNNKLAIKAYADAVGKTPLELNAAERSQAVLNAVMAEVPNLVQAGTDAHARQDKALSTLANSTTAFKLELSALVAGPMVKIVENVIDITSGMDRMGAAVKIVIKQALTPLRAILSGVERATRAVALVQRGELAEAALAAGEAILKLNPITGALTQTVDDWSGRSLEAVEQQLALKSATDGAADALSAQSGKVGGVAYAFDLFNQGVTKAITAQAKFAGDAAKEAQRRRDAARAAAAARAKAAGAQRTRQGEEFMSGLVADTESQAARMREIAASEAKSAQELTATYAALQDRVRGIYATAEQDPARKALLQQQQIEIDKTRELAEVKANLYLTSAQQAQLAAAIEVEAANKVAAAQREVTSAQYQQVQAYLQAGDAIANALLQGDAATRASAGLKALMAGAESFYQFSLGNIPGGIAAGAAAVQFARAALTSTPPTAQGSAAQAPAREPAQADRQGGSSLVVNLYGIATSKAEVGVNLQKAIKAALPTGMVPA